MQKFKPGDVVQLKSGGPHMTVEVYGKYGFEEVEGYKCVWFDKNKRYEGVFAEILLEPKRSRV